jgi:hypothetical protein
VRARIELHVTIAVNPRLRVRLLTFGGTATLQFGGQAMRLPVIEGLIERRILVNYRVEPDALRQVVPPPFQPGYRSRTWHRRHLPDSAFENTSARFAGLAGD